MILFHAVLVLVGVCAVIAVALRAAWDDPYRLATIGGVLAYAAGALTAMLVIG